MRTLRLGSFRLQWQHRDAAWRLAALPFWRGCHRLAGLVGRCSRTRYSSGRRRAARHLELHCDLFVPLPRLGVHGLSEPEQGVLRITILDEVLR